MAKIREMDQAAWKAWVATRPECVRVLCERLPPDRLYLLKSSGHRVFMYSYQENGTVTVCVTGEYNALTFERLVFGISPDDLEECDLPGPDEVLGAVLTEQEDVDAFIGIQIEERHRNGEKHNTERCRLCSASSGKVES
jgi:hypothetical protein